MSSRTLTKLVGPMVVLAGLSLPAMAQSEERPRKSFSKMLNVDALMDNYIRFLARKYDLSEEQNAFTEEFVQQKVDEFLDHHHDQLSGLVDRLFAVRTGGNITQEELIQWGREVLPIYEEAKGIIVEANGDWREILTDDQRLIHDEDVKLMYESFMTTEDQLQRIVTGQMTVEEFRNPPRRRPATRRDRTTTRSRGERSAAVAPAQGDTTRSRARPVKPRTVLPRNRGGDEAVPAVAGRKSAHQRVPRRRPRGDKGLSAPKTGNDFESKWETYVRQFIEKYQLNPEQEGRAYKVLRDCQQQGTRHVRRVRRQIEKLDAQEAKLKASKDDDKAKKLADVKTKRDKLLAPIDKIFDTRLKPRLEKIPTRAQREAAAKPSRKGSAGKVPLSPKGRNKPAPTPKRPGGDDD